MAKKPPTTGTFRCYGCDTLWVHWGAWCRGCGATDTIAFDPEADPDEAKDWETLEEDEPNEDEPIAAGNVIPTQKLAIPTGIAGYDGVLAGGYFKEVTGDRIRGGAYLFAGPRGSGKSRLTLASLSRPAKARLKVLYVSAEETAERLSMYIREADLSSKIHVYNTTDLDRALGLAEEGFKGIPGPMDILAIDSGQKMRMQGARRLTELSERVRDFCNTHPTVIVLLSQENRAGDPAGTNELGHDLDVILRITREADGVRFVRCDDKNRFGKDNGQWRYRIVEKKNGTRLVTVANPEPPSVELPPAAALPPSSVSPRVPMPKPPPIPQPPPKPKPPPRKLSAHPRLHIVPRPRDGT
jgi:predicted ATP-dependent serine protease